MKNKKYTVIIGCGRLGSLIANELSDKEENVTIIDCDKNSFRKLSPSYGGLTICANAMNMEVELSINVQSKNTQNPKNHIFRFSESEATLAPPKAACPLQVVEKMLQCIP